MVAFESTIERDLIYLLDFAADVASFSEQPYTINYLKEGLKRSYTPDFHVHFRDGRQLTLECKPEALVNLEENLRKFTAGETWAVEQAWEYQIITERVLRSGHQLANVKFLTRYARHAIPPTVKQKILRILDPGCWSGSISAIAGAVPSVTPALAMAAIFQMAFYHELMVVGLHEKPIDLDAEVRNLAAGEQYEYPSLFG
ncbi:MAG TPA: TnsA endonuclease N-terminal domain-containing protein [Chloroflexota bacterium]|nr:TnsA endonuclease N-terminal domain-containing protein [Chloroflexota bacterium]